MKRYSCNKSDHTRPETLNRQKTSKLQTPDSHKSKERSSVDKIPHTNHHFLRNNVAHKQRNLSPDIPASRRYSPLDESAVVEVTVKAASPPKPRSRSTVSDRQPWGQLLIKQSNVENESVFGHFDPLRTLHFLGRELQTHMQMKLPEETNLQEILKAMDSALKRIPPEVASTVQLQQQTMNLLKKSISKDSINIPTYDKLDDNKTQQKEFGEIQKLIEGNTSKLESLCQHLEGMCGQLGDEKRHLESLLQAEKANSRLFQTKLEESNFINKQLTCSLTRRNEEVDELKRIVSSLEAQLQEKKSSNNDTQSLAIAELKKSKLQQEQDMLKLQHQLRLCAIEKEKYLAILEVRDKQIYEIRNEMTQLQQAVNDQLIELHNCAVATVPTIADNADKIKDDSTISSIWANEVKEIKSDHSLIDLDAERDKPPAQHVN